MKYCKGPFYFTIVAGLITGLGLSGLMAVIHRTLESRPEDYFLLLLAFISLWIIYSILCILSEIYLIVIAEKTAFLMKKALSIQIFKKELRDLEEIGPHRLFAILVEDIKMITSFIEEIPSMFINGAVCLGCYAYMLWLSPPIFLFNICFLILSVFIYNVPARLASRYFMEARETYDKTIKIFRLMTEGIKNLLISSRKRRDYMEKHLNRHNEVLMSQTIRAFSIYRVSRRLGEILILANIGCLLFFLSRFLVADSHIQTGIILACLFSLSPLSSLIKNISEWIRVNVAIRKIQGYDLDLFKEDSKEEAVLSLSSANQYILNQLILEEIQFEYRSEFNGDRFFVGPITLRFDSGKITFITGGNGSGKTTLAKIICGLYPPKQGRIIWNNEIIDGALREWFSQNFSIIFSDYFLFEYLIGIDPGTIKDQGDRLLKMMELDKKIAINDGAFSSIDLSFGQRKRLALMTACMEDLPVYIFDEWAAGQAPYFKKIFYEDILQDLKERNKMVIVITHDDNFFHIADQIVKVENGQILKNEI